MPPTSYVWCIDPLAVLRRWSTSYVRCIDATIVVLRVSVSGRLWGGDFTEEGADGSTG